MRAKRAGPVWVWMVKDRVTELWYKIPFDQTCLKTPIPIHENYGTYKPNLNVRKIVGRLLGSIDPEYLQGLGSIVLSSQDQLTRKGRRKKFLSRSRKIPVSRVNGYYRQSWKGQPAFIELYVDRILAPAPGWLAHIPMAGFFMIAKTLFHEIGHHIHKTQCPEFKEQEDVAEQWRRKLTKVAFRKRYRYAGPFLRAAVKIFGPPIQRLRASANIRYDKRDPKN